MAKEETGNLLVVDETPGAVNPTILDYYKKFGRKRDLEQFFSLSTADNEVRDVTSLFWRRMKSQDNSDSGEKNSESSTELCRISIKCSIPDKSEDENTKTKSDSESPPIITEYVETENADGDSFNEDNESQKSTDAILDTSNNKPLSPTSSITSQRKLEWDSLADVGYENESGRKNSVSSLSTLERLALKQQYSNNDSKHEPSIGLPTAHSTLIDSDINQKNQKGDLKRSARIYKKDVDFVEVNIPHNLEHSSSHAINVNLTKHLSFKLDDNGGITIADSTSNINVNPEKVSLEKEVPYLKTDKEIQTSLIKTAEKSIDSKSPRLTDYNQKNPVMISLNTLKKRYRRKKSTAARKKIKKLKIDTNKENIPVLQKVNDQVSAAESFEYMPGHIYNQNQINFDTQSMHNRDNKSSLESSRGVTTNSSNSSKQSFSKDFEKGFELLKSALHRNSDSELKKKLIKEVVQRLLRSKYHDDASTTDFLSGLSFNSKQIGLGENCLSSSTSDNNNTDPIYKNSKPRKSILRLDKFNSNVITTTSQSAPNLPIASNSEKPIDLHPIKHMASNTDSEFSGHENRSSDTIFAKISSEQLYQKYLQALKREQIYKRHLKEKETILKQKLVCSETALKPNKTEKPVNDFESLLYDLTRNNYNDGSGDASKLQCQFKSNLDSRKYDVGQKQRSHSVFTLSSCKSDDNHKTNNLKKRFQSEIKHSKLCHIKNNHQCLCPHTASTVPKVANSSVQVNLIDTIPKHLTEEQGYKKQTYTSCNCNEGIDTGCSNSIALVNTSNLTCDEKYVCNCHQKSAQESSDNMLKCSQLLTQGIEDPVTKKGNIQCVCKPIDTHEKLICPPSSSKRRDNGKCFNLDTTLENIILPLEKTSKSSQTNIALRFLDLEESGNKHLNKSFNKKKTDEYSSKEFIGQGNKNHVQAKEITKYVQTELSINPKISDPSLTDINIINDESCTQVISEDYGHKSKKSASEITYTEQDLSCLERNNNNYVETFQNNKETCNVKSFNTVPSIRNYDVKPKAELNNDVLQPNADSNEKSNFSSEHFTIPIQGTNMTLMVKIGSQSEINSNMKGNKILNTPETKNKMTIEKTTCVMEECSKNIQSSDTDIFTSIIKEPTLEQNNNNDSVKQSRTVEDIINYRYNIESDMTKTNDGQGFVSEPIDYPLNENSEYKLAKKTITVNNPQKRCPVKERLQHTYPKSGKLGPKPFLRSNTDNGIFVTVSSAQTDKVEKVDVMTQKHESQDGPYPTSLESNKNVPNKLSTPPFSSDSSKIVESDSKECSLNSPSCRSNGEYDKDPILNMIKDITKRYSKKNVEKSKKKKCFKEIISLMNYLLHTDDTTDLEETKITDSSCNPDTDCSRSNKEKDTYLNTKDSNFVCVPNCSRKYKAQNTPQKEKSRNENKKHIEDMHIKLPKKTPKPISSRIEDKTSQSPLKKSKNLNNLRELSEVQVTTEFPTTSSDSATYKVLDKIKRECERYQQKHYKDSSKKNGASSSTSVNCKHCKLSHHCSCRGHRCYKSKSAVEKTKKKCIAYNLIIQTSDSIVSEETVAKDKSLKNVIVKIPNKYMQMEKLPFKEVSAKIEKKLSPNRIEKETKSSRSRSWPNDTEVSSNDDYLKNKCGYSVREYLEINRPDFVENTSKRQQCLKHISEHRDGNPCAPSNLKMVIVHPPICMRPLGNTSNNYGGMPTICNQYCNPCRRCVHSEVTRIANQRAAKRQLLSVQLDRRPTLTSLTETDIRRLAKDLGVELRRKKLAPKFISEREMKKHSQNIYKSLPEVIQKKEDAQKESIKRTNILMANIFKKNLQKKTLGGSVNLSNYSSVIKI